jgi:hypothetical protein
MPKGDNLKGKKTGNNFALNPQPSGAAKAAGRRRISSIKEAVSFLAEQLKSVKKIGDDEIEFTFESNIAFELMRKANEGDLNAIKIYSDWQGLNAPKKIENDVTLIENKIIAKLPDGTEIEL